MSQLATFHFGEPWWLLLLGLLPLCGWLMGRKVHRPALVFSGFSVLRKIDAARNGAPGRWAFASTLLAMLLIVLAVARPRVEQGAGEDHREGIDIVLCIDLSGSMEEKDFFFEGEQIPRSRALNLVLKEFVEKRPTDRFGIIGFASGTFLVSPLTGDGEWVKSMLDYVRADMPGTAIGDGIAASVELLREAKGKSKVVIVATDGDNNAGRPPREAAEMARAENVRVHALRLAPIRSAHVELALKGVLAEVAETTGGVAFQAADLDSLQGVYRQIDRMERVRADELRFRVYDELFPWFLLPAAFLLLLPWIAKQTLRLRIP